MSTLKKILLGTLGLALLAGILYMVQPVELQSRSAILWKVTQNKPNEWNFLFTLTYEIMPNGAVKVTGVGITYPDANNWSYHNRKKLPFPQDMQAYSVYFGKDLPNPGSRARIYFLKNKWTGNVTRDSFVGHVLPTK